METIINSPKPDRNKMEEEARRLEAIILAEQNNERYSSNSGKRGTGL